MPPKPSTRVVVSAKVLPGAVNLLDERAAAEGIDRAELIRRLLKFGLSTMPPGWNR